MQYGDSCLLQAFWVLVKKKKKKKKKKVKRLTEGRLRILGVFFGWFQKGEIACLILGKGSIIAGLGVLQKSFAFLIFPKDRLCMS